MPPNMLDERPIQYLPFLDRCMPSPLPIPNPAARKRNSLHFTPSLQSPMKRLKVANGLNEAGSTPQFKAETWFNDTNKDASGMNDVSFQDNDPPFYVCRRPSSDGNSICAAPSDRSDSSNLGLPTAPTRSLLARMDSSRSNSEDFRSVIDDLTIQNKKLKKRLRKYEKLHCSHLQEKKLFEVRIHGLSAHRKRELEETLRKFASTIEEESPEMPSIAPLPLKRSTLADSPLRKPSLSSALCSKPSDSAYASMSGQTGLSHSQIQDQNITEKLGHSRQENVKSYLHDMSQTFMPKHSLAMSDRSKSKLVVKWLEQIFTGKGAASRRHNQSHQQQEVSRSAAHADRNKMEARGRRAIREGVREAHILPTDMELQVDTISEADVAAQQVSRLSI